MFFYCACFKYDVFPGSVCAMNSYSKFIEWKAVMIRKLFGRQNTACLSPRKCRIHEFMAFGFSIHIYIYIVHIWKKIKHKFRDVPFHYFKMYINRKTSFYESVILGACALEKAVVLENIVNENIVRFANGKLYTNFHICINH